MKISSVIAPAILVASAQAQSWCQDALNGCFKEVNELRNTLDSHLAYKPVTCKKTLLSANRVVEDIN